jgi:hypothetical protein
MVYKKIIKVFFSCFSNTELILLGGYVAGASKLVEKYDIQTGNCMALYFSLLDQKQCNYKLHQSNNAIGLFTSAFSF